MSIDINVNGISETVRAVSNYSDQLIDKVVTTSLRGGAKLMRTYLQAAVKDNNTPSKQFPAGRLKRSIFFKLSKLHKRRIDGTIGFFVRPNEKSTRGAFASDGRYGNSRGAYYAQMVEDGYEVKGKTLYKKIKIGDVLYYRTLANGKLKAIKAQRNRTRILRPDAVFSSNGNRSGRVSQRTGKFVPGKHFIKKTYEAHISAVQSFVSRNIDIGSRDLARRLNLG